MRRAAVLAVAITVITAAAIILLPSWPHHDSPAPGHAKTPAAPPAPQLSRSSPSAAPTRQAPTGAPVTAAVLTASAAPASAAPASAAPASAAPASAAPTVAAAPLPSSAPTQVGPPAAPEARSERKPPPAACRSPGNRVSGRVLASIRRTPRGESSAPVRHVLPDAAGSGRVRANVAGQWPGRAVRRLTREQLSRDRDHGQPGRAPRTVRWDHTTGDGPVP